MLNLILFFTCTNYLSPERAMAPHSSTLAWKIPWMEGPGRPQSMRSLSWTWLSDFTFTFHFRALEKEMATHSSVLAWRIPGIGEPGGLPSMGLHRVGHDWSDLARAITFLTLCIFISIYHILDEFFGIFSSLFILSSALSNQFNLIINLKILMTIFIIYRNSVKNISFC